jgi:hypothetical protein
LLLAGDQLTVAHRVGGESAVHDEVRTGQLAGLVLDAERLDWFPDEGLGELFLGVGEPSPGVSIR